MFHSDRWRSNALHIIEAFINGSRSGRQPSSGYFGCRKNTGSQNSNDSSKQCVGPLGFLTNYCLKKLKCHNSLISINIWTRQNFNIIRGKITKWSHTGFSPWQTRAQSPCVKHFCAVALNAFYFVANLVVPKRSLLVALFRAPSKGRRHTMTNGAVL